MDSKTHSAITRWLAHNMPDVAATLVRMLTPEVIAGIAQKEAICGPYTVNIEELQGPITAIKFYVMSAGDSLMLAVAPTIKGAPDTDRPQLSFNFFFMVEDFPNEIGNEENCANMVDDLVKQCEESPYL